MTSVLEKKHGTSSNRPWYNKDEKQYMYNLQQSFECRGCLKEQYILQLVPFWQRERPKDS